MTSEWKEVLSEVAKEVGVEYEPLEQTDTQVPEPTVNKDELGNLSIVWNDPGGQKLQCQINKLTMQKDGMYSYVSFRVESSGKWRWILEPGRINWYSMSSKTSLRRELDGRDNRWDWKQRLAQVVVICAQSIRGANSPEDLSKVSITKEEKWIAAPLLEADEHTVLFAAAGTGKSLLALGLCVQAATGRRIIPGINPPDDPVKVLYLDWETSQDNHARRMAGICDGVLLPIPSDLIYYWRMEYPLVEAIEDVRAFIISNKIGLVVIDSAGLAADGDVNSTEVGTAYIKTVRAIGNAAVLTITHMSHDQIERGRGKTLRPIGSVYFQNGPRSSWGLVGDQDESTDTIKHLGLVHVKSNNAALKSPIGFIADFTDKDKIIWKSESVHTNQTIAQHTTTNSRITNLILSGGRYTLQAIYDELDDLKTDTISRTVRRMVTAKKLAKEGDEYFALIREVPDTTDKPKGSNPPDTTDIPNGMSSVRLNDNKKALPDSPPDKAGQSDTVRIVDGEEVIELAWDTDDEATDNQSNRGHV